MKHEISRKNFEMSKKKSPLKSFITEMQFDRETDLMNIIAKFHNFGRILQLGFKRRDSL